jgi:glutathione S-transferase
MIQIIGSPISPYVKKVLVLLNMKGVAFEVDPITPFLGGDRFSELSPLRRIPVFIDGDLVLNDSSVIAQYIEETWPAPAALPDNAAARAHVRWLEEYSDSRLGDIFIWKCFAPMAVAPRIFKTAPDAKSFADAVENDVPEVMAFLEKELPADGFIAGEFGLADASIAAMFTVMGYVGWAPDAARWPKTHAWLARANAVPAMALANKWSDALIKVRAEERRKAAAEIGLALTAETLAVAAPRRGPMTRINTEADPGA